MAQEQGFTHPEFLADTTWVSEHLDNPKVRLVDCDVPDQYLRAHLPGATFMEDHYQKDPDTNRIHILGSQDFASLMESLGIGDDTLVVGYDNSRGLYAARLWWALNYYGHTNVKVMNGGWRRWLSQGLPATTNPTQTSSGAKFTPKVNPSLMVTTDQLKEDYKKDNVVVWDVRSRGEYTGETSRDNQRTGHIAGSVHLEWLNLVDNDTHLLKSPAEIRMLLESHGITPDKRIEAH